MKPEDVLIAITCSGESVNVVHALEIRNTKILLTGPAEDSAAILFTKPDIIIRAMAQEITVQEDIHSIVCHAIARGLMDG
jgi:phosphoheptose isomerase